MKQARAKIFTFIEDAKTKGQDFLTDPAYLSLYNDYDSLVRLQAKHASDAQQIVRNALAVDNRSIGWAVTGPKTPPILKANYEAASDWLEAITAKVDMGIPVTDGAKRENFDAALKRINAKEQTTFPVFVHELGHALDDFDPSISANSLAYLDYRAAKVGAKLEKLSTKYPNLQFQFYEEAYLGAFDPALDPVRGVGADYVAKDYRQWNGTGSEITSTGIEWLAEMPERFIRVDREYANLILGLLDGRLR